MAEKPRNAELLMNQNWEWGGGLKLPVVSNHSIKAGGAEPQPQCGEPIPNVLCSKHPESGLQIRQPGQLALPTVSHQPVNQTPFWPFLLVWPLQVWYMTFITRSCGEDSSFPDICKQIFCWVTSCLKHLVPISFSEGNIAVTLLLLLGYCQPAEGWNQKQKDFFCSQPSECNVPVFLLTGIHPFAALWTLLHTCTHQPSSSSPPHRWKANHLHTALLNSS